MINPIWVKVKLKFSFRIGYEAGITACNKSFNKWANAIENNIGYVDMSTLEMKDVDQMMKTFENTKAIIIDIRNYPKFIPYLISNYLNSEKRDFVKIIIPDLKYPSLIALIAFW